MNTQLNVEGMVCEGCSDAVHRVVTAIDGVSAASVDHVTGATSVEHDAGVETAALVAAIRGAGFDVAAD